LAALDARLQRALARRLADEQQRLTGLRRRLGAAEPSRAVAQARQRLATLETRLHAAMPRQLERRREQLAARVRELQAVSPLAVLGRGYAILENAEGEVIRRSQDTRPGERLKARLGEGRLSVEVKRRYR
ncbi:exodeoxyribonuclease VII large subunit, partial [Modicisalibacter tunisiensis]|uniref:exodeoxyribonuclease VII large subunit n=1 Tax=Modicisalibacter tunisiensis TaxID=390637 RepID=UPI002961F3D4